MPGPKAVPFIFKRTKVFRRAFDALPAAQQKAARNCFAIFKWNPYDPRLNPHIIKRLTALRKTTIMSVTIEGNLKAVFSRQGNLIVSEDIGTHDIYQ